MQEVNFTVVLVAWSSFRHALLQRLAVALVLFVQIAISIIETHRKCLR